MTTEPESKSLLERISELLTPNPSSPSEQRRELLETLKEAQADGLIDADALAMIEGVFQVSELSARDILIPRAQIDWIDINESVEDTIAEVIRAAHSRFPVYENNRDNVIGILLARLTCRD
jgi:magnesium and cobalt transporter